MDVASTVTATELAAQRGDSDTETAAKIGAGAVAGAVVGKILGKDAGATVAGASVGAAVGTVLAVRARGGEAELRTGSRITVELDEALTIG